MSIHTIHIINGPNLNLLGKREPHIYGDETFTDYLKTLRGVFSHLDINYFQSNHEGALIDTLQQVGFESDGILLNAGGLTHTSIALADTVSAISSPVVEVHISNIYERETFRHHSFIEPVAHASIVGHGLKGYEMAIHLLLKGEI
jgi:3-dehydroquinate dehydratase II